MCDQVAYVKKFRIHVKKITKFAREKSIELEALYKAFTNRSVATSEMV